MVKKNDSQSTTDMKITLKKKSDNTILIDEVIKITENIEGFVSTSWNKGIKGWIWDRSQPYQPLVVELLANDEVIAKSVADDFDMVLAEREIGNGKHAFKLRAKSWPELDLPVKLSVRIVGSSHLLWSTLIETQPEIVGLADATPIGHVDGVFEGELKGWAFDLTNPSESINVDILDNGEVITSIYCSEHRKDLSAAGYDAEYCGFSFALPISLLDGQTHLITVCYSGTRRTLPNGTFLYGITSESALTNHISNLVLAINKCQTELATVEQRLLARHEALLLIQRENMERELQVLRKLLINDTKNPIETIDTKKSKSSITVTDVASKKAMRIKQPTKN